MPREGATRQFSITATGRDFPSSFGPHRVFCGWAQIKKKKKLTTQGSCHMKNILICCRRLGWHSEVWFDHTVSGRKELWQSASPSHQTSSGTGFWRGKADKVATLLRLLFVSHRGVRNDSHFWLRKLGLVGRLTRERSKSWLPLYLSWGHGERKGEGDGSKGKWSIKGILLWISKQRQSHVSDRTTRRGMLGAGCGSAWSAVSVFLSGTLQSEWVWP